MHVISDAVRKDWAKWTWKDYYDDARRLAKAFIK